MLILTVYILTSFVLLIIWVGVILQVTYYNPKKGKNDKLSATSIVIAAHNEQQNLTSFLPQIVSQLTKDQELIVVNDHSTDGSIVFLKVFSEKNPQLKVIDFNKPPHRGKKWAVTEGLKHAIMPNILLTDADCMLGNKWVSSMSSELQQNDVCLGYGGYLKNEKWVNALVRFETIVTAGQYFGMAILRSPYMGVGRNLAYKKSIFTTVNGFQNHLDILSGDDDLFIQDAAQVGSVGINIDPASFTFSKAPDSFSGLFKQKGRHVSTANRYSLFHKFWLGLLGLSNLLFYPLAFTLLICQPSQIVLGSFLIVVIIKWIIFARLAKVFQENSLVPKFILLDISFCFLLWALLPFIFIQKRKWN